MSKLIAINSVRTANATGFCMGLNVKRCAMFSYFRFLKFKLIHRIRNRFVTCGMGINVKQKLQRSLTNCYTGANPRCWRVTTSKGFC